MNKVYALVCKTDEEDLHIVDIYADPDHAVAMFKEEVRWQCGLKNIKALVDNIKDHLDASYRYDDEESGFIFVFLQVYDVKLPPVLKQLEKASNDFNKLGHGS